MPPIVLSAAALIDLAARAAKVLEGLGVPAEFVMLSNAGDRSASVRLSLVNFDRVFAGKEVSEVNHGSHLVYSVRIDDVTVQAYNWRVSSPTTAERIVTLPAALVAA